MARSREKIKTKYKSSIDARPLVIASKLYGTLEHEFKKELEWFGDLLQLEWSE
jgi:hypothetical protein